MRRSFLISLAAAITAAVLPVDAHAASTDLEQLRLECAARVTDTRAAVVCEWSSPTAPTADRIQLYRLDPEVDPHRQVVFRTGDLTEQRFVDVEVRRGHRYAYAVVVRDENGRIVARSRTDWVRVPAPSAADAAPEREVASL